MANAANIKPVRQPSAAGSQRQSQAEVGMALDGMGSFWQQRRRLAMAWRTFTQHAALAGHTAHVSNHLVHPFSLDPLFPI